MDPASTLCFLHPCAFECLRFVGHVCALSASVSLFVSDEETI